MYSFAYNIKSIQTKSLIKSSNTHVYILISIYIFLNSALIYIKKTLK